MGRSEVSRSVVKCSEVLSKRVSIVIRRCTEQMKFCCFFHILLVLLCFTVHMVLCFVNYVFLLLCMFCSVYSVSLCCSVYCLCVNVYCTTATGCQPNCSLRMYHIIAPSWRSGYAKEKLDFLRFNSWDRMCPLWCCSNMKVNYTGLYRTIAL